MDYMFYNADAFNQDIGQWNVSQVTTMESMFRNTAAFNQDIGCWNVSQVTSMHSMFSGAAAFNQDIRLWYPPDTLTRTNMFNGATAMINHYGAGGVSDDSDFDDGNNNGTPNRNFFDYQVKFGSNKTSSVTVTPNENQDTVGNASATHKYSGNLSYSKSGTDTDDFNIDNTTGALTFATTPDYETKSTYTVIVTATDTDGNSATQTITVDVQNLNDNTPQITSSAIFNNIQENQTTIGQVNANDADGNLNTLIYSVSGDELAISSSGEPHFVTAPDYETKSTYTATVTVSDGTNSTTQDITVNVQNLNDNTPQITSSAIFTADENQLSIGQVNANDADGNLNTLIYSVSGDELAISSSGEASLFVTAPDYETKSTYTATVTVSDGTNSTTQDITVNITNLNDNTPQITSSAIFTADENQLSIGQVNANDADGNLNTLIYSVSGDELAISSSGELTFVTAPDYETKNTYTATVTVSDGTNSTTQDITVNVQNLNDNTPQITSSAIFTANENQTAIGTVIATDADGNLNNLTYSVSGGELEFANSLSGEPHFCNCT